jgi:hypothetical protein
MMVSRLIGDLFGEDAVRIKFTQIEAVMLPERPPSEYSRSGATEGMGNNRWDTGSVTRN